MAHFEQQILDPREALRDSSRDDGAHRGILGPAVVIVGRHEEDSDDDYSRGLYTFEHLVAARYLPHLITRGSGRAWRHPATPSHVRQTTVVLC